MTRLRHLLRRPKFNRRLVRLWLMGLGTFVSLILFVDVVDDVFHDPMEGDLEAHQFDHLLIQWLRSWRGAWLTQAMTDLTALGSVSVISTLFIILASVLASYRDFRGLSYMSLVLAGAALWPSVLKAYFRRPRPDAVDRLVAVSDFSFPSGHTFGATALYIALAYYAGQYARRWSQECFFYSLGFLMIVLVGTSRIYLGAHYPTDVLGGVYAGAAWGLGVSVIYEWWTTRARPR